MEMCPECGEVFCQSMEGGTEFWYTKGRLMELVADARSEQEG